MIAVELELFKEIPNLVDASGEPMGVGRLEGPHLGRIIKHKFYPDFKAFEFEQSNVRMMVGFFWEWAVEQAFKVLNFWRPRQDILRQLKLTHDGIHVTIDAIDFSVPEVMEEYKATWKTMRHFAAAAEADTLAAFLGGWCPAWLYQIAAYLKALQAQTGLDIRECKLYILFMLSSYEKKFPAAPAVRVVHLTFTQEELDATWADVLETYQQLKADGVF